MSIWSIYTLADPRNGEIRYVGQTVHPEQRLRLHLVDGRQDRPRLHKSRWIRTLLDVAMVPIMRTIVIVGDRQEADRVECAAIAMYRSRGCRLTNGHAGGGGMAGYTPSDDARARMAAAAVRRKISPETRAKMCKAQAGHTVSEATRRKIAVASLGKTMSPEMRAKVSLRHKGVALPEDHRQKIAAALTGRTVSPETRAKQSERAKERKAREMSDPVARQAILNVMALGAQQRWQR